MIIDFHTHVFPDDIAARAIATLEKGIHNPYYENVRAVLGGKIGELQKSMTENNIDISVVLPVATNVRQHRHMNEFAKAINDLDGIYSFGGIHPMQEDWEETLYDIKEKCLKGIKLHPEYQECYIDSPESLQILKKCQELNLLVVLHAGKDHGTNPPVHCTPQRLRHALEYVNGGNIIAAHMGGWDSWDDVEKYLVGENIYFDTAYTAEFMSVEQFFRIIKSHGSKKIIYGTDSPWEEQNLCAELIKSLNLTDEEKDDILYKNGAKLLGINA